MLDILTHLFAAVCGQAPAHTWAPGGIFLPCCQRCTGLYAGAAVAAFLHWRFRPILSARFLEVHGVFLLLMAPFGFHWVAQGPVLRTVTGMLFGFGVVTFLWLAVGDRSPVNSGAGVSLPRPACTKGPRGKEVCAGGTSDNSPALQRWVLRPFRVSPEGTAEPGPDTFKRTFGPAGLSPSDTPPELPRHQWPYALGLGTAIVLVPLIAAKGGTLAAALLSALVACGALILTALTIAFILAVGAWLIRGLLRYGVTIQVALDHGRGGDGSSPVWIRQLTSPGDEPSP
jgi:uncharacterized membrane protein